MLTAPENWYAGVPGVTMAGPINLHFITDIGLAFLASGAGVMLGARKGFARKFYSDVPFKLEPAEINSRPGLFLRAGELFAAITIETDGERIIAIYAQRNPEKLARILRTSLPAAGSSASV